jgi:hypothetical protein
MLAENALQVTTGAAQRIIQALCVILGIDRIKHSLLS